MLCEIKDAIADAISTLDDSRCILILSADSVSQFNTVGWYPYPAVISLPVEDMNWP
jgi:hypothetical protein